MNERARHMETAVAALGLHAHGIGLDAHPPNVISMPIAHDRKQSLRPGHVGVTLINDEVHGLAERTDPPADQTLHRPVQSIPV